MKTALERDCDYLLEKRLQTLDPDLHSRFTDTVFVLPYALDQYQRLFPEYTDHSVLHCMNVVNFCNILIGPEQIEKMNAYEIYVLLMSCYLHDIGMAITAKDYQEFKDELGAKDYFQKWPNRNVPDFVRDYHNEFSGLFIKKYAEFLEIPSPELTFAIVQVARGHRRVNLFDHEEYPEQLQLADGNTVSLPYLAALIRLADEIDVVADRNPKLLYDIEALTDSNQIFHHRMHEAVPDIQIFPDGFLLEVKTDDEALQVSIEKMAAKMRATLDICRAVAEERSSYHIFQKWVELNVQP